MIRKRLLMLLNWQSAALFLEHREGLHRRGLLADAAGSEEDRTAPNPQQIASSHHGCLIRTPVYNCRRFAILPAPGPR
ncbi:MAG: hypothetical protein E5V86_06525 [Mesorhizobium sp.]|nr:MAG: hypothetical protein E5W02_03660 [Mesorhizobium sp.]TIV66985.1 MAG: hypothetical protein E5V86_06525 [Mesorhizobium sp.]